MDKNRRFAAYVAAVIICAMAFVNAVAQVGIKEVKLADADDVVMIVNKDGSKKLLQFYGPNIFRVFQSADGNSQLCPPKSNPPAEILVADAKRDVGKLDVHENKYCHQWARVKVGKTWWICDPYGLYCGPEPGKKKHPYLR